jgi:predicted TIM-barrel fold metal-dependent hydrolase
MRFFDANAYVLPGDLAGQLSKMRREHAAYRIRGALISPLGTPDELNEPLLKALSEAAGGYYAAVAVGGRSAPPLSGKVKAVRVDPAAGREGLIRGAELAEREGLTLLVSLRSRWGGPSFSATEVEPILTEFRSVPIVLSGVNYGETAWLITSVSNLPHVYVEVSMYHQMGGLRLLAEELGANRLLFGTAYPLQPLPVAVLKLLLSGLSEAQLKAVAWDNAVRVLRVEAD